MNEAALFGCRNRRDEITNEDIKEATFWGYRRSEKEQGNDRQGQKPNYFIG